MSETSEIEVASDEVMDVEDKPKRSVGFKTLGIAALLAIILGAAGSAFISKTTAKSAPSLAPIHAKLEILTSENKALKDEIAKLQRRIKAIPKPASVDLSNIEFRLKGLETVKPQTIDTDLVERLEALKSEGSEALDLSDITRRLDSLETIGVSDETRELIQDLYERVAEWEIRLEDARTRSTQTAAIPAIKMPSTIDFPKASILAALEAGEPSAGWLQKTLKKHISVQSENNPHYLVELIEADIENSDMSAAITKFDKLPDEAKLAAQDWRSSLERQ